MNTLPELQNNKNGLTIQQAANILKVSSQTMRRWEQRGLLVPQRTAGNQRRYLLSDVLAFKQDKKRFKEASALFVPPVTSEAAIAPQGIFPVSQEQVTLGDVQPQEEVLADAQDLSSTRARVDNTIQVETESEDHADSDNKRRFTPFFIALLLLGLLGVLIAGYAGYAYLNKPQGALTKVNNGNNSGTTNVVNNSVLKPNFIFSVNVPSFFRKATTFEELVTLRSGLTVDGEAVFNQGLSTNNQDIDAGTGNVFAANIPVTYVESLTAGTGVTLGGTLSNPIINASTGVTSLGGSTGALSLVAGDGISVSGLTISNTDRGSAQNIFKSIIVSGQDTIQAGSNSDSLTFVAGTGVVLTTNATGKELLISAPSGSSQWSNSGSNIYYNSGNVGIGNNNPTAVFDVTGSVRLGSLVNGVLHADGTGLLSASAVVLTSDVSGILPVANGGTGANSLSDLIALGTNTTGDYVMGVTGGSGITITGAQGEGWTPGVELGALTADWSQTGPFDIILDNSASELLIREASGANYGIFDVTDLAANRTYTFPDASGEVCLDIGNCGGGGGGISGSGTANFVPRFISANAIGNSNIYDNGLVGIGTTTPTSFFTVNGTTTGQALVTLNETGGQDIFTASASGTTRFTIANNGTLTASAYGVGILHSNASGLISSSAVNLASADVTGILPVLNGGTGANTLNDLITLGTMTTGNYVATITGNSQISVGGSGFETAAITLAIAADSIGDAQLAFNTGQDLTTTSTPTFNTLTLTSLILGSDTVTDLTGTGLQVVGNALQTTLGTSVDLTSEVTGILPLANGGTNANLTAVNGGIVYSDATGMAITAAGSNGQVLVSNGAGAPTWADAGGVGTNFWQRNAGALSPLNITDDLLVGGIATTSARFQIFADSGNATTSGVLTFGGTTAQVQSTSNRTLSLGGNTTGNVTLVSRGSTALTADGANLIATGTLTGLTGLTVSSGTVSLPNGSIDNVELANSSITFAGDTGSSAISLGGTVTVLGGTGISSTYAGGTFTIDNDGVLSVTGTTNQVNVSGSTGAVTFSLPQNIDIGATPTFSSLNLSSSTNQIILNSAGVTGTLSWTPTTTNKTITFPDASGEVCLDIGNCGGGGGGISGSGTTNYITKFTGATAVGNSSIFDNGQVGIGTTTPTGLFNVSGAVTGQALTVLNETGGQDIFTASASGLTRFTIANNGTLTASAYSTGILKSNATGIISSSAVNLASGDVTGILPVVNGGTGSNTLNDLIALGTMTTGDYIATIAGSSQVSVSGSGGETAAVTIGIVNDSIGDTQLAFNTGQDLTTTSSPTFNGLTVSSLTRGADTITDFTGTGLQLTAGVLETTLGTSVDLTSEVNGVLPIANGGTNTGTLGGAGSVAYSDGSGYAFTGVGTGGYILTSNGASAPTWTDPTALGTNYWQRNAGSVSPLAITDDILVGGIATSSALIRLGGTTGTDSFFNTGGNVGIGLTNPVHKLSVNGTTNITGAVTLGSSLAIGGDTITDFTGSGLQMNGTVLETTLGTSVDLTSEVNGILPVLNGGTGANTLNDLITLGTMTTGNYVATITGNSQITVGNSGTETAAVTLSIAADSIGDTQLAFNTGQDLTTTSSPTFDDLSLTSLSISGDTITDFVGVGLQMNGTTLETTLGTSVDLASAEVTGILPLTNGGTNASLTAVNGGIVYSDADSMEILAAGTSGYILTSTGAGAPTWTDPAALGTNYWQRNAGALSPLASSDDILVGSNATSSALIRFGGTSGTDSFFNSGGNVGIGLTNPVHKLSVSGTTNITGAVTLGSSLAVGGDTITDFTGTGLQMNGTVLETTLGTSVDLTSEVNGILPVLNGGTGANTLNDLITLGTMTTGNYVATITGNSQITVGNSGTETAAVTLSIAADSIGDTQLAFNTGQDLTTTSSPTFNGLTVSSLTRGSDTITDFTGAGLQMNSGALETTLGTSVDLASAEVTGILPVANGGTGVGSVGSAGSVAFSNGSTYDFTGVGTGGYVLTSAGSGTPVWTDPASLGTNFWQRNNGTLSPLNITDDLLVGGIATTSARFQIFADSGNATTSGVLTFGGTTAQIQSTEDRTLSLGGSTTGNITLVSRGSTALTADGANLIATGTLTGLTGLTVSSGTVSLPNGSIDNVELANSSITFAGDSGTGAISLGGTITIAGGTGMTSSYSAGTLTINGDDATTSTKGIASFDSSTFTVTTGAVSITNDSIGDTQLAFNTGQDLTTTSSPTFNGLTLTSLTIGGDTINDFVGSGLQLNGTTLETTLGTDIDLTSEVTGMLPIANGGTNTNAAPTDGGIAYGTGTAYAFSAAGISGQVLQSNGAAAPSWIDAALVGTNYWQRNGTSLAPLTATDALIIGGGTTTPYFFEVNGAKTGKALSVFNETGDQNIITASSSGTTKFNVANNGNIGFAGGTSFINTLTSAATTARTYTFPDATGDVCLSTGNCAGSGGSLTGSGTANFIAKFTTGTNLSDSSLFDNGLIGIGTTTPVGKLTIDSRVTGKALAIFNETGDQSIFTASSSGTTRFTIGNTGTITATAYGTGIAQFDALGVLSSGALNLAGGASYITGVLPIANGGTNTGSLGSAGSVSYSDGSAYAFTGVGASGQILVSNGTGAPTWEDAGAAGVNYLQRNLGALSPLNITDDFLLGGNATASALIKLGGTANATTYFNTGGNIGIGMTTPTSFLLEVAGNVGPDADGTRDLGSLARKWNAIYVNNIYPAGSGTQGYWQRLANTGAISTTNITDDVLFGGTATSSAKFAFINNAAGDPVASISAQAAGDQALSLSASGTIQTYSGNTLTIGGSATGNIVLDSGSGSIAFSDPATFASTLTVGGDTINDFTGTGLQMNGTTLETTLGTSVDLASAEVTGILTLNKGGTNANLTAVNGGVVYSDASGMAITAAGNSGQILQSNGAAAPTWVDASTVGTNYFQLNSGSLSPITATNSLVLGGNTTTPFFFEVNGAKTGKALVSLNETGDQDIFTASASGTTRFTVANNGVLTASAYSTGILKSSAAGVISSAAVDLASGDVTGILPVLNGGTGANTLNDLITLGTMTTGNYVATITGNSQITVGNSGTETAAVTLSIAADSIGDTQLAFNTGQDLTTTSSPTFNGLTVSSLTRGSDTITDFTGTGLQMNSGSLETTLGTSVDLASAEVTGILPLTNGGTNASLAAVNGGIVYSDADSMEILAAGTSGYVLTSTGAGAPTWTDPTALGTNYWQRNAGALSPLNITDDLLVGGIATSSAKFQVFADTGSATTSGTLTFGSTAQIQSTSNRTLALGGNTTGNITLVSRNSTALTIDGANMIATGTLTGLTGLTVASGTVSLPSGSIDNVELANSSITFAGDSGTGAVSLGGTLNILGGTGLTSSYAAGTLTINGDDATTSTKGIASFDSSTFTVTAGAVSITADSIGDTQLAFNTGQDLTTTSSPTFNGLTVSSLTRGADTITDFTGTGLQMNSGSLETTLGTSINLASAEVTGILPLANGGTNANLTADNGGIVYSDADSMEILAAGTSGYVLQSNGVGAPSWVPTSGLGTNYWQRNLGALSPLDISDDLLVGATATSSALVKLPGTVNQDAFFNLGTGNVGIGITNPVHKLSVSGTTNISGATTLGSTLGVTGNTTLTGDIAVNGGDITSTGALTITPNAGSNLNIALSGAGDFAVNTNQIYADTSSGSVGIGTTAPAPNAFFSGGKTLQLHDTANLPNIRLTTANGNDFSIGADASSTYFYGAAATNFRFYTNALQRMHISSAGNVGIGSTSPEALLEIQGVEATDAGLALDADDGDDATDTWFIKSLASGNNLSFVNDTTEVMAITSAGNLDTAGTLTAGTANAFTVSATGAITTVTDETINGIDISAGAISDVTSIAVGGDTINDFTGSGLQMNGNSLETTLGTSVDLASAEVTGILTLNKGGTNANLTAVNGGVVYSDASGMAISAAGTSGQILQSNGAATPTWVDASTVGTNYFQLNSGSLAPITGTNSLVLGGNTTTPFFFEVNGAKTGKALVSLNETGDQAIFTASASGTTRFTIANNGILTASAYSTGILKSSSAGVISSAAVNLASADVTGILPVLNGGTGANTLNDLITLGTMTTGNYVATVTGNSQITVGGSGSETAAVTLSIAADSIGDTQLAFNTGQDLTTTSSPTFNGLTISSLTRGSDTITDFTGTGLQMNSGSLETTLGTSINLASAEVTGVLPLANGGTNANLTAVDGGIVYSSGTAMAISAAGNAGEILQSNGAAAPTWVSASTVGTNYFQLNSGSLSPITGTNSFVLGGNTTTPYFFEVNGAKTGKALAVLNETGDQAIFSASASGTTRFTIANNGTLTASAYSTGILKSSSAGVISSAAVNLASADVTGILPVLNGGTGANTLNDLITLGTMTTGNYVATVAGNSQITVGGSGSENAAVTLSIAGDSIGDTQLAFNTGQDLTTTSSPTFNGLTISSLTRGSDTITDFTGTGLQLNSGSLETTLGTSVNLASAEVTGVLPIANGGTNGSAAPTNGGVAYGTGTAYAFTGAGTAGYFLQSNGAAAPTWIDITTVVSNYWQRAAGALAPAIIADDLLLGANATASALIRLPGTNNQNAFFNLGTGNVGIGLTNPVHKLSIAGTTNVTGAVTFGSTLGVTGDTTLTGDLAVNGGDITSTGAITMTPTAGNNLNVVLSGTGDFVVNTNQLYADSSTGNVGIGITNPVHKLSIVGTTNISGALSLGTSLALAGDTITDFTGTGLQMNSGSLETTLGTSVNLASAEVTGVLPIANGGTNSSAAPTAGGIAYGDGTGYAFTGVGTGGYVLQSNGAAAPTWVSASTVGVNYWQKSLGALSSTSISDDVLVGGSATASALIRFGGTANADSFFNTGGNVGIGTTTPSSRLSVEGTSTLTSSGTSNAGQFFLSVAPGGSSTRTYNGINSAISADTAQTISGSLSAGYFSVEIAAGATISDAYGVRANLNKYTSSTLTNSYGFYYDIEDNVGTITNTYGMYVGNLADATQTNIPFAFYAEDINAYNYFGGNVGFGTTTPTSFKIEVAGNIGPSADDTYDLGSSAKRFRDIYLGSDSVHMGTNGNDSTIGYDTTGNYMKFNPSGDGSPELVMLDAGNLGIGTTAPESLLEVQGAEGLAAVLTLDADDGDDAADTWAIESQADNEFVFKNDTTELFKMNTSGNLSIEGTIEDLSGTTLGVNDNLSVNGTTGLTLSGAGSGVVFQNGETITNAVNDTLAISTTTLSLVGTSTITASSLATFTTAASLAMSSTTTLTLGSNATLNGGSAANDDLTLQGTSNGTRANSYVLLQPTAGNVGIGNTAPTALLGVGSSNQFTVNSSGAIASVVGITSSSNYVQSAGTMSITSANTTQVTTASALALNVNSLTSGTGLYAATSTLTSGKLVDLQISGTAAAASQTGFNLLTTGANATSAITTYGAQISNTHSGTTSTNVGLYLNASGGTTANYALLVNAGNVGIGTTTPTTQLMVSGSFEQAGGDFKLNDGGVIDSTAVRVLGTSGILYLQSGSGDATIFRNKIAAETMRLTNAGNLGIGTTLPGFKLDVNGDSRINGDITVSGNDVRDSGGTARLTLGTTNTITGILATTGTADIGNSLTVAGNADIAGVLQVDLNSTAGDRVCWGGALGNANIRDCVGSPGDYAEEYGTSDTSLEAGDIVSIDATRAVEEVNENGFIGHKAWIKKAAKAYQQDVIGIVSTQPNEVIGQTYTESENARPVALSGRVPVKVSIENGEIKGGDYLTSSSVPGIAMKATQAGTVIGKALEGYNGSESGKIVVFVNTSWYDPDVYITETGDVSVIAAGTTGLESYMVQKGTEEVDRKGIFSDVISANIKAGEIDASKIKIGGVDILDLIGQGGTNNGSGSANASGSGEIAGMKDDISGLKDSSLIAQNDISALHIDIDSMSSQVASMSGRFETLESLVTQVGSTSAMLEQLLNSPLFTGSGSATTITDLTTNTAIIGDTLNVLGRTTLTDLGVTGNITAGTLSINGLEGSINTIGGPLKLQDLGIAGLDILNGKVTINTDGDITTVGNLSVTQVQAEKVATKKLQIDGASASSSGVLSASAGVVTIEAGDTSIDVSTSALTTNSLTFTTPDSPIAVGTKKKDSNTFTIKLSAPQATDVKVNWWIVN